MSRSGFSRCPLCTALSLPSPSPLGPADVIFCVSLPGRGRRWFRAHLPRRKGVGPLHPSSPVGETPRAWTPSLRTEPRQHGGGADCQRAPFKSHEPGTLRNPHAIRLRSSVSLGSSCRARPAAVRRPWLSTGDESPALKPFFSMPAAARLGAARPARRALGCSPCRRDTGSRTEPGESPAPRRGTVLFLVPRGGGSLLALTHLRWVFLL